MFLSAVAPAGKSRLGAGAVHRAAPDGPPLICRFAQPGTCEKLLKRQGQPRPLVADRGRMSGLAAQAVVVAVADEKDRRTLDYLLTTDLGDSEIVFGKLIARLATLSLILLTGLPIFSLLQFP